MIVLMKSSLRWRYVKAEMTVVICSEEDLEQYPLVCMYEVRVLWQWLGDSVKTKTSVYLGSKHFAPRKMIVWEVKSFIRHLITVIEAMPLA